MVRLDARDLALLVALGSALFALLIVATSRSAAPVYLLTLPPVVTGGALTFAAVVARDPADPVRPALPRPVTMTLPSVVLVGALVLSWYATTAGSRTVPFYLGAGLLGTGVLLQIAFVSEDDLSPTVLLGQVLVIALVVRFAALATTAGYIGLDTWSHVPTYVAGIAADGSLESLSESKYYYAPLYHLTVVATVLLADVSPRLALWLSIGLVVPIVTTSLLYVLGTSVLTPRWATFAAALYAFSDHAILWGIYLVPTSLGLVFTLGLLVPLFRIVREGYSARSIVLFVAFSLGLVFTHQVSSVIAATIVGMAVLAQVGPSLARVVPRAGSVNLLWLFVPFVCVLAVLLTITPYTGSSLGFAERTLLFLRETYLAEFGWLNLAIELGAPEADYGLRPLTSPTYLLEASGLLLFAAAGTVGTLVALRRATHVWLTLVCAAGALSVVAIGTPAVGLQNFLPSRWFAFLYVPLALLCALGLQWSVRRIDPATATVALVVFCALFPGVMALAGPATIDSPTFPEERITYSYSRAELAALETISRQTTTPIGTDVLTVEVLTRTETAPAEIAAPEDADQEVLLYRESYADRPALFDDVGADVYETTTTERRYCATRSITYDNGAAHACVA
ncbi:hypothetical protein [Halalkalicoccus salilacus]|uniref:hypothetical protein n=1 Tax=Halalkalicoccus TaxID=332246 RepID=UPI002F96E304